MSSLDQYKTIIDELVERSHSVVASRIRNNGCPDSTNDAEMNTFIAGLDEKQRELVARLIEASKVSGIHDTLAYFSELQNLSDLTITVNGKEIPQEPFGSDLHFDFIARKDGEDWPK